MEYKLTFIFVLLLQMSYSKYVLQKNEHDSTKAKLIFNLKYEGKQ